MKRHIFMTKVSSTFEGQCILVLGLGLSGRSAAHFLLRRGARVVGADRNYDALTSDKEITELCCKGMTIIPDNQECKMKQFNLMVVSPGILPSHPYYEKAINQGIEVIGEVELACRSLTQQCLGITGTNGKTTVTLLVAHILNHAGMYAKALGNVGIPLTSAIDQTNECKPQKVIEKEIFVIELSSFQLDTLKSQFIDAGVILNITPDHLDRYGNMNGYAKSKIHLSDCLKSSGKLFVEDLCLNKFHSHFELCNFLSYGYSSTCFVHTDLNRVFVEDDEVFSLPLQYKGKASHDLENVMAAYALCREVGISAEQFLSGLQTFKKPPHRIQFVRTVSGVNYYDDSKGTNIDAVIRAVDSLDGKIILIAGGVDKGSPYTPWLHSIANRLKSICAIGKAAEKIKRELGEYIPVETFLTLDDAVARAAYVSQAGDTVLLSPGCASYDMFKDYAHRGEEFQRLVKAL